MRIYHIHFRKTGGTALRRTLQKEIKPKNPLMMFSDVEFFAKVPVNERQAALERTDFISGHFGRVGPLVPDDFFRICVLRDPLRRIVSGYNHILGDQRDPLHAAGQAFSFCQAMESNDFSSELWNHQSRLLVENAGENFEKLTDLQRIECCITFLNEKISSFGVLEHPAEILIDLQKKLGISLPSELQVANSDVTANGAPKSTLYNCISSAVFRNRVDLAVYSYVLSALGH